MSGLDERPVADIANELRELGDPLADEAATALERVAKERDKWIRQAGKHFAKECELADRALTAEAKLAEALARLETVEAETRELCARELSLRRLALDHQTEVLDIAREMDIYDICTEAVRNMKPRHD